MENGNTVGRDTGDKYNLFLEAGAGLLIIFAYKHACDASIGIIFVPPCNQKSQKLFEKKSIPADIKNLARISRKFTANEFSCGLLKNYVINSLSNIRKCCSSLNFTYSYTVKS